MHMFLIDVNLPYYFSLWNSEEYIHLKDINQEWSDEKVWDYASENNLTIITKDSDFSKKILLKNPPPKVIHIKIGNMRQKELYLTLSKLWKDILDMSENYKLVNVYKTGIEGIN
jgi:predicted nuclease of predicted toxin-antitoxin system